MLKYAGGYAATLLVMLAIDALWIGVIAKALYQRGIGHLMAPQPDLWAAGAFYLLYPLGLLLFVVLPQSETSGLARTFVWGALFGFFAYATYDLTNLATLKGWPLWLSAVDLAWGSLVSGLSAAAGKMALDRLLKA
jgi:uncharacterized membrane protein